MLLLNSAVRKIPDTSPNNKKTGELNWAPRFDIDR